MEICGGVMGIQEWFGWLDRVSKLKWTTFKRERFLIKNLRRHSGCFNDLKPRLEQRLETTNNDPIKHRILTFPRTKSVRLIGRTHTPFCRSWIVSCDIKRKKRHKEKSCFWKESWSRLYLISGVRLPKSLHVGSRRWFFGEISPHSLSSFEAH